MCTASAVSTLELVHIYNLRSSSESVQPKWLEHLTSNQKVTGLIPIRTQNYNTYLQINVLPHPQINITLHYITEVG